MNQQISDPARLDDLLSAEFTRTYPALPEEVYSAWTDPAILKQWWGPEGVTITDVAADVRQGGAFRFDIRNSDGREIVMRGVYLAVEPPHRLVMEFHHYTFDGAAGRPEGYVATELTVSIAETATGSELRLNHHGFLNATQVGLFSAGWTSSLDKLGRKLGSG